MLSPTHATFLFCALATLAAMKTWTATNSGTIETVAARCIRDSYYFDQPRQFTSSRLRKNRSLLAMTCAGCREKADLFVARDAMKRLFPQPASERARLCCPPVSRAH